MFEVGDYVVNGNKGICRIEDELLLDMSSIDEPYYLLIPVDDQKAKIYIPVTSSATRIRKILTKEEAWNLIDRIPEIDELWVENEKQREQKYREAVNNSGPELLVSIIKNMYMRNQRRSAEGKKSTALDERYFRIAENNLYGELAFAIGEEKDRMREIIVERIEKLDENEIQM